MAAIPRSHATVLGFAALLSLGLLALITTPAHDDPVTAAPEGPARQQTSGNDAGQTPRPITAPPLKPSARPIPSPTEGRWEPARSRQRPPSVASIRLAVAQQALLSDGRESLVEAAAFARYERGGYNKVEAAALPNEAKADVRWAPERLSAQAPRAARSRAAVAAGDAAPLPASAVGTIRRTSTRLH
jgi:hypothetical protein